MLSLPHIPDVAEAGRAVKAAKDKLKAAEAAADSLHTEHDKVYEKIRQLEESSIDRTQETFLELSDLRKKRDDLSRKYQEARRRCREANTNNAKAAHNYRKAVRAAKAATVVPSVTGDMVSLPPHTCRSAAITTSCPACDADPSKFMCAIIPDLATPAATPVAPAAVTQDAPAAVTPVAPAAVTPVAPAAVTPVAPAAVTPVAPAALPIVGTIAPVDSRVAALAAALAEPGLRAFASLMIIGSGADALYTLRNAELATASTAALAVALANARAAEADTTSSSAALAAALVDLLDGMACAGFADEACAALAAASSP